MRTVADIFGQIFRNLWAHKLRSFLTMFGIAWGVGSLLLLVGVGEGFRSGNKRELAEFGKDIMFLFPGRAPAVKGNMVWRHKSAIRRCAFAHWFQLTKPLLRSVPTDKEASDGHQDRVAGT